jgi:asparagine synthase (glutamine-hydrolysing)
MIISGIINNYDTSLLENIILKTESKIKKNRTIFSDKIITLIVGNTSDTVYQGEILKFKDGILIGRVFSKDSYRKIRIDDIGILSDKTDRFLIDRCWGSYIFIRTNIIENLVYILRDPIGQFNLFYKKLNSGAVIFSSSIEVLYESTKEQIEYNINYCAIYMLYSYVNTDSTIFNDVSELSPGYSLKIDISKNLLTSSNMWKIEDYCKYNKNIDIKEQIIFVLENVIKSWTENSQGVFLDFSGGTDSTSLLLIANKILDRDQILNAVNIFHPSISASDERNYASSVAQTINIPIIEFDRSNSLPFDDLLSFNPKLDLPSPILVVSKFHRDISRLSSNYKNITYMSGHGGDHIFLCPTPLSSICDYFIERGLSGLYLKIKELSFMFRMPLFKLLKIFAKDLISYSLLSNKDISFDYKQKLNPLDLDKDFINLENKIIYNQFIEKELHKNLLPGKLSHINSIFRGLTTIKKDVRDNRTNAVFYPLFSQPMIELALSIPSYDSFDKGFNRYHFRKSISNSFNTNHVWRKDKGDTSGSLQLGIKKNQDSIKNLCLNGRLFNMGILKEEGFVNCLKMSINGQSEVNWSLINLVSLELFFKSWS